MSESKTQTKSQKSFRDTHTFEKRKSESEQILTKYEDRIPVIVEKQPKSDIADIDKKKFLVPSNLTLAQFTFVVRKRVKLTAEQALWMFVETKNAKTSDKKDYLLPPQSQTMSEIYATYKNDDGFLYITYSGENTFGCEY